MKEFSYFELISVFYLGVFDQVRQDIAFDKAINITFDSYWFLPEEENRIVNFIVLLQYMNVKYALHKSFDQEIVALYKMQLAFIKEDKLSNYLNNQELEHILETIEDMNAWVIDFES